MIKNCIEEFLANFRRNAIEERYKSRIMVNYFSDEKPETASLCSIRFRENRKYLDISIMEKDCIVEYSGYKVGTGNYELKCEEGRRGKAALYKKKDSTFLVGLWEDWEERKGWSIELES